MEKKKDPKEKAFAALINYLSYRDRSIAEAKQYLEKKEHARAAIRQAIEKAMEYGYLDDEKFADVFVRGKVIERKTSPKKIQFELGKKEVSQAYIHKALQTHYGEDVEEEIVLSWIEKLDQKYRKEP
ncbi:MAG TPA: hypothetical protein DHN33_10910, partial [Eubacteriaceae bacterium]|nr:hypothetical protein [Eubacteriaceae bacterium]